jgi:hypothetical protein
VSKNGIDHRHCKWPLGTEVWALTPNGYLKGRVNRHTRQEPDHCDVAFDQVVDMGNSNGSRFCHVFPFRSLRRAEPQASRPAKPWYKEGGAHLSGRAMP